MRVYSMGLLYAVPNVANPTPVPIASLKGVKVGVKQAKKGFRGNMRDIVDVGDGARDWPISIDVADFRAEMIQFVVPGVTPVTGARNIPATPEQFTIPATPFQVTVSQGATFAENAGVYDMTAGKFMSRGATATGAAVYAVNVVTGQYTFNTADAGHVVLISYAYSSATLGRTTTVNNITQSQSIPFQMRVYNAYQAIPGGATRLIGQDYPSVHFEELDLSFQVEDFMQTNMKGFASQDMIGGTSKTCVLYDSELG